MTDFSGKEKEYLSEDFKDLDLSHEKIDSTLFEDCSFKNCNFTETEFMNCRFIDCSFSHCNLSVMKIDGSEFCETLFEDSKLMGIDWTGARWPDIPLLSPIKFFRCILDDSVFMGLSLNDVVIEECKAREVDFREGSFSGACFRSTDFAGSLFNETDLSGADFTDAVNYRIDLNRNRVKGAKFSRQEAVSLLESLGIELVD